MITGGVFNHHVHGFGSSVVDYQSWTTQGLATSYVGDALFSIYVSASGDNSTSEEEVTKLLLWGLVSIPSVPNRSQTKQTRYGFRDNTGVASSNSPGRYVFSRMFTWSPNPC